MKVRKTVRTGLHSELEYCDEAKALQAVRDAFAIAKKTHPGCEYSLTEETEYGYYNDRYTYYDIVCEREENKEEEAVRLAAEKEKRRLRYEQLKEMELSSRKEFKELEKEFGQVV